MINRRHWTTSLLGCVLAGLFAAPAAAQVQRMFPQTALRGQIVFGDPPEITLNGRPARLAPGARIRAQNNMLEMSGALLGSKALVHYTVDNYGLLKDVWILRPEELANKPWPVNAQQAQEWEFDPTAQTWSKP